MSLFSWLHNRSTVKAQSCTQSVARFRPRLESLEKRDVPSTLTVTSNVDNLAAAGTLRYEIDAAKPGDTIVFAPSLDGTTINLIAGQLTIDENLTISGPGAGLLTIKGELGARVFNVIGGAVAIGGLTIEDHVSSEVYVTDGGGIYNDGALTVTGCTFASDYAYEGGGIFNLGTATVSALHFSKNVATYGGGIYNAGQMSVSGCSLSHNTATMLGGGIYNAHPAQDASSLTISDTEFAFSSIYGPYTDGGGNTFE